LIVLPPGNGPATTNYLDMDAAANAPVNYYRIHLMP
jgi:hypothetical protein